MSADRRELATTLDEPCEADKVAGCASFLRANFADLSQNETEAIAKKLDAYSTSLRPPSGESAAEAVAWIISGEGLTRTITEDKRVVQAWTSPESELVTYITPLYTASPVPAAKQEEPNEWPDMGIEGPPHEPAALVAWINTAQRDGLIALYERMQGRLIKLEIAKMGEEAFARFSKMPIYTKPANQEPAAKTENIGAHECQRADYRCVNLRECQAPDECKARKATRDAAKTVAREDVVDVDAQVGLYQKYQVERLNDSAGKHRDCEYFVLDLVHDKFAIAALFTYAHHCKKEFPELALDLNEKATAYAQNRIELSEDGATGIPLAILYAHPTVALATHPVTTQTQQEKK